MSTPLAALLLACTEPPAGGAVAFDVGIGPTRESSGTGTGFTGDLEASPTGGVEVGRGDTDWLAVRDATPPSWFESDQRLVVMKTTSRIPHRLRPTSATDRGELRNAGRRETCEGRSRGAGTEPVVAGCRGGGKTGGVVGNSTGLPRASQKSSRFFRLVATKGWSGSSTAVAIAQALR